MKLLARIAMAAVAALGVALVSALVLTIIDLYLSGHGYPTLSEPLGASYSAADLLLLTASFSAAALVWWASGRMFR
jgi:hypothetical protein